MITPGLFFNASLYEAPVVTTTMMKIKLDGTFFSAEQPNIRQVFEISFNSNIDTADRNLRYIYSYCKLQMLSFRGVLRQLIER